MLVYTVRSIRAGESTNEALDILIQQPEVDPEKVSIVGHNEGTFIAPRIAIDNPDKVDNIVLMATAGTQNLREVCMSRVNSNSFLNP